MIPSLPALLRSEVMWDTADSGVRRDETLILYEVTDPVRGHCRLRMYSVDRCRLAEVRLWHEAVPSAFGRWFAVLA